MSDVVAAVDVGGTTMKGARVDARGRFSGHLSRPTPAAAGPEAVMQSLLEMVDELCTPEVAAVGVVVPGAVDAAAGFARFSANLGWRDVPVRDLVAARTGRATALDHDVRAAGLAEATVGAAAGAADCLVAVLGTGIAAVLTAGGRRVAGATRLAGELGHVPVFPDGELCPCGQTGCLERYASAAAVSRRYATLSGRTADAEQVAALRGTDPAAAQAWQEATTALGIAIASATMLLDPSLIVLGGGLSAAGPALLHPVRAALARRVVWRPAPEVVLSPIGVRAGMLGAAIVARRAIGLDDFDGWQTEP